MGKKPRQKLGVGWEYTFSWLLAEVMNLIHVMQQVFRLNSIYWPILNLPAQFVNISTSLDIFGWIWKAFLENIPNKHKVVFFYFDHPIDWQLVAEFLLVTPVRCFLPDILFPWLPQSHWPMSLFRLPEQGPGSWTVIFVIRERWGLATFLPKTKKFATATEQSTKSTHSRVGDFVMTLENGHNILYEYCEIINLKCTTVSGSFGLLRSLVYWKYFRNPHLRLFFRSISNFLLCPGAKLDWHMFCRFKSFWSLKTGGNSKGNSKAASWIFSLFLSFNLLKTLSEWFYLDALACSVVTQGVVFYHDLNFLCLSSRELS